MQEDPAISFLDQWDSVTTITPPSEPKLSENDLQYVVPLTPPDSLSVPEFTSSAAQSTPIPGSIHYSDMEKKLRQSDDLVMQLKSETISLRDEKEQLLNELNYTRDAQFEALERTKREVSSNYDRQITNLQQSLVDTEERLQNVEQQFEASKRAFSEQDDRHMQVLAEQVQTHAQELVNRDQEYKNEILRITEELRSRPADGGDADEWEAERMKMMKDKMKELHEAEKQKMSTDHCQAMELLKDDLQKKLTDYQGQAENAANAQIKIFHQQCMDALRAMEEENKRLNAVLGEIKEEMEHVSANMTQEKASLEASLLERSRTEMTSLEEKYVSLLQDVKMEKAALEEKYAPLLESTIIDKDFKRRYASLVKEKASLEKMYASLLEESKMEKASLEEKYASLLESRSEVADQEVRNKFLLEEQLRDWMDKASQLEAKLASTETMNNANDAVDFECAEQAQSLPSLVGEYETQFSDATAQHREELTQLRATSEKELADKMQESQEQNRRKMQEVILEYESQLSNLREENSMTLNESTDKASLEVAEEHMRSLHEQLNKYRNQEKNFEVRLADMKQEHIEAVVLIRKQCEEARCAEVSQARAEVSSMIKALENELALLKAKENTNIEITENLRATHQQEMENLKQKLTSKFREEMCKVEQEIREEGEKTKSQILFDMEGKLTELTTAHQLEVCKLEGCVSQMERTIFAKSDEGIKELESHILELESDRVKWESSQQDLLSQLESLHSQKQELEQSLSRMDTERKQISEDCDRFQKRVKSQEMNESITKSAEEQFQEMVVQKTLLLDQQQAALDLKEIEVGNLSSQIIELECKVENLEKEGTTRALECQNFIDQLAAKNQAYADAQVEIDSLKTNVDALKKQHIEDEHVCDRLRSQLQNSWGVSEEIEMLKVQVVELTTYKDGYGDLNLKVESLEEVINCKDGVIADIKRKFDEVSCSLEDASRRGLLYEEENTNYAKQVEVLQNEFMRMEELRSDLEHQVSLAESALLEKNQVVKSMEQVIAELESKLEYAENHFQDNSVESSKAEEEIKCLDSKLKLSYKKEKLMLAELQEKEEALQDLSHKLTLALGKDKYRAVETEKQNEEIDELNYKLAASFGDKEALQSELLSKEQEIVRLNGLISEKQKDSSEVDKMADTIEAMQTKISGMEMEVVEKADTILDLNLNISDLEARLSLMGEDVMRLEEEKSQMQLDLLGCQSVSHVSDTEHEWAEKCSKLEENLSKSCEEKMSLAAELNDLRNSVDQPTVSVSDDTFKDKCTEQEKIIQNLKVLLAAKESPSTHNIPFDAEILANPLGATLTRARKTLMEKLEEKDAIEKELSLRRAKLERQMSEKQRLEDLLFEKKRFEQELQTQKSLLKKELEELEARNNSLGRREKVN